LKNVKEIIHFATRNKHKFLEAKLTLQEYGIHIKMFPDIRYEIQSNSLEEIAKTLAMQIAEEFNITVLREDAGLFIDKLKGFPGPYSSYVFNTIGVKGVLKLMEGEVKRNAEFRSAVAFCKPDNSAKCFRGSVKGNIALVKLGKSGFGFDPIFIPLGGGGKTFAQMTRMEKRTLSHRTRALRKFANWYLNSRMLK
jgi:XTP/dITP diphosphohydrolase